jgi:hypothetical protein
MLVGGKERKFKSPTDGRILPVSAKIYKLADKGEGQVRISLTAPIEALAELDAMMSWLERATTDQIPTVNVLRVAIQQARERCTRSADTLYAIQNVEGEVQLTLTKTPFGEAATPAEALEGSNVEWGRPEEASEPEETSTFQPMRDMLTQWSEELLGSAGRNSFIPRHEPQAIPVRELSPADIMAIQATSTGTVEAIPYREEASVTRFVLGADAATRAYNRQQAERTWPSNPAPAAPAPQDEDETPF